MTAIVINGPLVPNNTPARARAPAIMRIDAPIESNNTLTACTNFVMADNDFTNAVNK